LKPQGLLACFFVLFGFHLKQRVKVLVKPHSGFGQAYGGQLSWFSWDQEVFQDKKNQGIPRKSGTISHLSKSKTQEALPSSTVIILNYSQN
jgi:hypothetical protein